MESSVNVAERNNHLIRKGVIGRGRRIQSTPDTPSIVCPGASDPPKRAPIGRGRRVQPTTKPEPSPAASPPPHIPNKISETCQEICSGHNNERKSLSPARVPHSSETTFYRESNVAKESSPINSHKSMSPNGPWNQTNPKNRMLGRTKFTGQANGNVNQALNQRKANMPSGGQKCFNFSYKEPDNVPKSIPQPIAIQTLGSGKHILDPKLNGQITYIADFYEKGVADKLFYMLLNTLSFESFKSKDGSVEQPRLTVWFAPKNMPYSYSYVKMYPNQFSSNRIMSKIKSDMEAKFNCTFNSCLVNLYRDNKDGVSWHADDEKSMGCQPTIGSVSLGEVRRFEFCRKFDRLRKPVYGFHLAHGSALLMKGDVQENWMHCVPKEYHERKPRINLTFRTIVAPDA